MTQSLGNYSINLEVTLEELTAGLNHATAIMAQQTKEMTGLMNLFAQKFDQSLALTKQSLKMSEAAFKQYSTDVKSNAGTITREIQTVQKASEKASSSVGNFGKSILVGIGGLIGINLAMKFQEGIKGAYEFDEAVRKLSLTLGTNAKESSELAAITEKFNISADSLSRGLTILTKNAENNSKAFKTYNIDVKDSNGNLLSATSILENVADKYVKLGGGLAGAAMAQSILGRGGKDLIPILAQGKEGIQALAEEAQKMGLVLSTDTLNSYAKFKEMTMENKEVMTSLTLQISNAFLPVLTALGAGIEHAIEWWNSLDKGIKDCIVAIGSIRLAVIVLSSDIVTKLCASLYASVTAFAIANAEWLAPVAIFAAVGAAAVALSKNMFHLADTAKATGKIVLDVFQSWEDIRLGDFASAGENVKKLSNDWNNVKSTATSSLNSIGAAAKGAWSDVQKFFTPSASSFKLTSTGGVPQTFTSTGGGKTKTGKSPSIGAEKTGYEEAARIAQEAFASIWGEIPDSQRERIIRTYQAHLDKMKELEISKLANKGSLLATEEKNFAEKIAALKLEVTRTMLDKQYQLEYDSAVKSYELQDKYAKEATRHQLAMRDVSATKKAQMDLEADQSEYSRQSVELDKIISLYQKNNMTNFANYQKFIDKKKALDEDYNYQMLVDNNKLIEAQQQKWTDLNKQIATDFEGTISDVLSGGQTLSAGLNNLFKKIYKDFTDMIAKMIVEKTALSLFGSYSSSSKSGGTDWLGTLASLGKIAMMSFDVGTMSVPNDMIAQIHKGEMIVPANFADGVKQLIAGGGSGGSSITYAPVINTVSSKGFEEILMNHSKTITSAVAKEQRYYRQ